jgi:hypothetical protein
MPLPSSRLLPPRQVSGASSASSCSPAVDRAQLGPLLTPAGPGHPWHGVTFTAAWGSRDPLEFTPVEPTTVAEFRTDSAIDADRSGVARHRHPVRYLRLRSDVDADSV